VIDETDSLRSRGAERPGVQLPDGRRIDASGFGEDYDESFFGAMARAPRALGRERGEAGARRGRGRAPRSTAVRPSKIICVGLNYRDHAKESGMAVPAEPVIFFKATTAIVGPNDDVIIPKGSTKTDWESSSRW
jgi:2-keto-4-pentenoate hydratase/2-oxohepta-3-ene-1,7-dioic acid hydratase in catechol pathway